MALARLQSELVGVQSSLFSLGLELEASQRRLRQSQRQGDDLMRLKDRLISDLQEVLQHREVTEKHNQVGANLRARARRAEGSGAASLIRKSVLRPRRTSAVLYRRAARNFRRRRRP